MCRHHSISRNWIDTVSNYDHFEDFECNIVQDYTYLYPFKKYMERHAELWLKIQLCLNSKLFSIASSPTGKITVFDGVVPWSWLIITHEEKRVVFTSIWEMKRPSAARLSTSLFVRTVLFSSSFIFIACTLTSRVSFRLIQQPIPSTILIKWHSDGNGWKTFIIFRSTLNHCRRNRIVIHVLSRLHLIDYGFW